MYCTNKAHLNFKYAVDGYNSSNAALMQYTWTVVESNKYITQIGNFRFLIFYTSTPLQGKYCTFYSVLLI